MISGFGGTALPAAGLEDNAMTTAPATPSFTDILYGEADGTATITINRPKVMNAFRAQTVEEMITAFMKAGWN